ncbi:MAG: UDP-N-acetylglucosamine--N-acetylmuramyl-(pentapeptide) pyrophosphoryl-undecaprenol N-acetylglucosamine transferase [Candidatus Roizmanbacteria bacterium]
MKEKILITGGHFTPALAVIELLKKSKPDVQIVFVGRKYQLTYEQSLSLEYKEIQKKTIEFYHLEAGRLTRTFTFRSIRNIIKIPLGFIRALQLVKKIRPSKILVFGGYIALPIAVAGYVFRTPVYMHEQTISPGIANRIIAIFCRKIAVSFLEAQQYFPKNKSILTGNPIRENVFNTTGFSVANRDNRKVIYITGGSLGSHSLNVHIENIVHDLLKNFIVIHQTGDVKEYNDLLRIQTLRNTFPENMQVHYIVQSHFSSEEVGGIYALADLVVARSGANSLFELLALHKPALFIPLPWSAHGEQQKHAEYFVKNKLGEIFNQYESSNTLKEVIMKMMANIQTYKYNFTQLHLESTTHATENLLRLVFEE